MWAGLAALRDLNAAVASSGASDMQSLMQIQARVMPKHGINDSEGFDASCNGHADPARGDAEFQEAHNAYTSVGARLMFGGGGGGGGPPGGMMPVEISAE